MQKYVVDSGEKNSVFLSTNLHYEETEQLHSVPLYLPLVAKNNHC